MSARQSGLTHAFIRTQSGAERPAAPTSAAPAPTFEALAARFRPIFSRIAERAAEREHARELAFDAVGWLREARFGALRVPVEHGGFGASVEQFFALLIELAEADSNLPNIFRAHFGQIERLYAEIDPALHAPWLRRAAAGELFGNATTEIGDGALGKPATRIMRQHGVLRLNGTKYYSSGSLYADWIAVSAQLQRDDGTEQPVIALVRADAPGVERIDDWNGFGQRLTGSGTTRLTDVEVDPASIWPCARSGPTPMTAFFQLVHLATLTGIARAIERDACAYVRPRKRVFSHGSGSVPREDPLIQQVVGQLASTAYLAGATVGAVAAKLGDIDRLRQRGEAIPESLLVDVELAAAKAQVGLVDTVLTATTRLFDVGGASAVQEDRRLDRHWRNARTLASHNPVIFKARVVGDHAINGTAPGFYWTVGAAPG
ncbi:MAG TPA: acyl-CoA dehydrogenase family protein [Thauera sp.]|uniref:acyl-CoA dehydrogenase family protein n=1 Tax=Thauera sp. TaxID=1905334 RepID=UPI002C0A4BC1|nr:acyl-CoA dehydrogenase family protein [Thauera sp.]HRP24406.1 acyl-CoA dehydrogenase family protein [Thauera sp.]HRP67579.1 acyl-CoA dehydrogenase family protein [Thauera sp.]